MAGLWTGGIGPPSLDGDAITTTMTNKVPDDVPPAVRAQPPYFADDEIDLIDLWLAIARKKKLFFGVFAVVLALTVATIVVTPRVYESRAVIQIGRIGTLGVVEQPQVVVERITQQYRVNDTRDGERNYPRVESVSSKKEQTDIFALAAHGRTPESARDFLATVVDKILEDHQRTLKENTDLLQQRLAVTTERVKQSRELLDTLGRTAEAIKNSDSRNVTVLLQEKTGLARELPQLEQDEANLRSSLLSLQTHPSRLLREPTLPEEPIRPRPTLYAALGIVVGGMLGLLAVFVSNFRERLLQRRRAPGV